MQPQRNRKFCQFNNLLCTVSNEKQRHTNYYRKRLVGFYGTAALYRLYRAGDCVVNVRVIECAGFVELYYATPPMGLYCLAPSITW